MTKANESRDPQRPKVLLIDDDREFCSDLAALLSRRLEFLCAHTVPEGLERLTAAHPDAVLLDVDLGSGQDGLAGLLEIRRDPAAPPVIMLTGDRRIPTVVEAMRLGAYHYLPKPPGIEEIVHLVERAMEEQKLRRRVLSLERDVESLRGDIVAQDPRTLELLRLVARVAPTDASVFITGESGTGKELIARRIHDTSRRADGPFVVVNCPAVPKDLIESEVFGHEAGAFTDAKRRRLGAFELANGGTLFLDELGDSPPALQAKILRVLESSVLQRVGSEHPIQVDVRVISATNRDVPAQLEAGTLREDLFYRLNVYPLHIPPLRERPGDILRIAYHFLALFASRDGKPLRGISPAAEKLLLDQPWGGNVRQLRNVIERAVIDCQGERLDLPDLGLGRPGALPASLPYDEAKLLALQTFKRDYVLARLRESAGNVSQAAERSGLKRQSFQRMMQECRIDPRPFRTGGTDGP
jgi:DNA-binding NtrC family response regulator